MTRKPVLQLAAALLALALGAAAEPASAPAVDRLRKMVALAEEARGELDGADAARALATNEALARRHHRALADLERGRAALAGPPEEVRQAAVEQALHFADRARAELEDLVDLVAEEIRQAAERQRRELVRRQREEEARRQRIGSELRDSEERARQLLSRASAAPSPTPAVRQRRDRLSLLLQRESGVTADQLEARHLELEQAIVDLRAALAAPPPPPVPPPVPPAPPPAPPPPAALRTAVEAYFENDYQRALEILAGAELSGEAMAHGHLLRAASRFALHARGAEPGEDLLAAARSDVRSCRRAAPDLVPDPRFFSPRFREFFAGGE